VEEEKKVYSFKDCDGSLTIDGAVTLPVSDLEFTFYPNQQIERMKALIDRSHIQAWLDFLG
jgi:hypothetical protein